MRVTYGQSIHGKEEINAVLKVLKKSTQMGKNVDLFEKRISKSFDKKFGVMVNSGSSALLLAFEIINLPKNSEVITPVLTFSTTVSSILKSGLMPKFVDVDLRSFCIDLNEIEKNITKKTRAICVPNLVGNIPNWIVIAKIAKKYNLIVVEDSADTLGGKINKKPSGSYSDISITSFYGSHIINGAGNGGMLCVNKKAYYKKALLLRSWGRRSSIYKFKSEKISNRFDIKIKGYDYDKKFVFDFPGYNFEPSEISAAFGLIQLKKLKSNIKKRIKNFNYHYNFFENYKDFFILPNQLSIVRTAWLAFPIIIKENKFFTRKHLQIFLENNNIQTRVIFTGNILKQPGYVFLKKYYKNKSFDNADKVMKGGMLIGCHHGLSNIHLNFVHKKIDTFIKKFVK